MKVKATILSENSVFDHLGAIAEHVGLFILKQTMAIIFLISGKALINNIHVFKKDLLSLKGIILSHHHIDHTGGLLDVVKAKEKPIDVYAHPDLFKKGYLVRKGYQYIGVPYSKEILESNGANFIVM